VGRGQLLVEAGDEAYPELGQVTPRLHQCEVIAPERRARIAADEDPSFETGGTVAPDLLHRQSDQRLDAGHEGGPLDQRVLVVERDRSRPIPHPLIVARSGRLGRRVSAAPTLPPLLGRRPRGVPVLAAAVVVLAPGAPGDLPIVVPSVFRRFRGGLVVGLRRAFPVVFATGLARLVLVLVVTGRARSVFRVVVGIELVLLFLTAVPAVLDSRVRPVRVTVLAGEDMVSPGRRASAAGGRNRHDGAPPDRQHGSR